ncbi:MAG TPA: hypothetical protein VGZ03_11635 [Acidimicrobiales bacterium]|nr:hypothetical protein [Acidimicrobiales bacterium]
MTRRIEIELTSKLDDGRYTWRAAGAREPRGTVGADLVGPSVKLGEVLRAEVETGIDGVDVLSIVPRKEPSPLDLRGAPIEMIGPARPEPGVQVTLASKSRGRGRDGERGSDRDERGPRGPRGPRAPKDRERSAPRPSGPRGERAPAGGSAPRGERPSGRTPPGRGERGGADRGRSPREPSRGTDDRRGGPPRRDARRQPELTVSTVHRNELLATLRPEQLPIAEQLLRGGLPAVRQAIDEQNRAALAQGRPTVAPETILTIADDLLPLTSLAAWKDRASAVQAAGPSVRLRDLRPVVTSARTVTLDEEARSVLKELQGQLHAKLEELRTQWVAKVQSLLDRGEVVEALRVVARPPDAGTRCPAELATALTDAAGAALDADLTATAWIAVLDAVVASPMRRSVHPAGIPAFEEAQAAAVRAAGHVPALAKLLGMRIPPPPPPTSAKRPALSGRRSS